MSEAEYQDYLRKKSYDDLLAIRGSLDSRAQPVRYAMVLSEIDGREKLILPPPLPGSELEATWRTSSVPDDVGLLSVILLGAGFVCHIASFFLMSYAGTKAILRLRLFLDLAGILLFVVGCVRLASRMGRSRFYGLFGLLGLIGLAILIWMPKKTRQPPLQNQT